MISGGGKRKGNAYERSTCKKLSLWTTLGERDDIYWRSATSGALATIHNKKGSQSYSSQSGDIVAIDPLGQPFTNLFTLECKHYKDLQIANLVSGTNSILEEFILIHFNLAKSKKKYPLLIVKQNFGKDLLITPDWFERQFRSIDTVCIKRLNCCIFNFDNFIKVLPFSNFMDLVGNPRK